MMVTTAMKLKTLLGRKAVTNLGRVLKKVEKSLYWQRSV